MEASTSSSMEASPSTRARSMAASALTADACVASLVDHAARSNPNGVALSCGSSRSTWRELAASVGRIAAGLRSLPSFAAGARVALLAHNSALYVEYVFAIAAAGGIVTPLNTRASTGELRHVLDDSGAAVLCLEASFGGLLSADMPPPCVRTLVVLPRNGAPSDALPAATAGRADVRTHGALVAAGAAAGPLPPRDWGGASGAFGIFYTSGTTGGPKGVVLSHAGQLLQALNKRSAIRLHRASVYLGVLPLFHVGGLSIALAVAMAAGTLVLHPPGGERPWEAAWRAAAAHGATLLVVVPTVLELMLGGGNDAPPATLPSVEALLVGGSSLTPPLVARAAALLPRAQIVQTYACTEAGSSITFKPLARPAGAAEEAAAAAAAAADGAAADDAAAAPAQLLGRAQPVGWAVPLARIAILDEALRPLPAGAVGQIATAGPHLMLGYWRQPALSAAALADGGWLLTGDLGVVDGASGELRLVGRIKDVIKTGGESVHAAAVERAVLAHPRVREVAVVGVPDDALGERVVAAVVLEAGAADRGAVWEALPRLMRDAHLPQYARPRGLVVRDALPRNSMGKVVKHRLQRELGVHGDVGIL